MKSTLPLFLQYCLAMLPILILLGLMVGPRWSAQKAGPAAWLCSVVIAILGFGLTPEVFWVSQARGLLLSLYVLAIIWPALLLYNIINNAGGIRAIALGLEQAISDRGLLLLLLAWAFSGVLEGLAGFGLPIAIVSPMLVGLGVNPVISVAAVAVGHAWAVTFGDMGVIIQTLSGVTGVTIADLAPSAALMLGAACLLCGLAAARVLHQGRLWPQAFGLGAFMAVAQYTLATNGLSSLAALGAGIAGLLGGILISRPKLRMGKTPPEEERSPRAAFSPALTGALASYGGLIVLMTVIAWPGPLRALLYPIIWQAHFPEVRTLTGFITPAGPGQAFRPLIHPGSAILLVALLSYLVYRRTCLSARGDLVAAARATWRSGYPSSVGIIAAVGLSALMEHAGMTQLLAEGLAALMGATFPLVSPLVGILGAFCTGSNNNSNVLFGPLQKSIAQLLALDPRLLLAAQTTGGALGSMIAPAKITVGCSTVGLKGREGDVLRMTLFYGIGIGLLLGGLALLFAR